MIKLKSLKLNQLGQAELEGREMNHLMGGGNVCTCTCLGSSSTATNDKSNTASDYGGSGDGQGNCLCKCRVGSEDANDGGYAAAY